MLTDWAICNENIMGINNIIEKISAVLGESLLNLVQKSGNRVYIKIPPEAVMETSRLMFETLGARFQIATGVDTREGIEVMYHWALDCEGLVVTIRTVVGHDKPALDSIASICVAAEWIEREMWELLGIHFRGHPDLRHLLLDDNWPEGNYPLRHNFRQDSDEVTP
jgi:NADH-quinone oxidoreductase subunit C